MKYVKTFCTCFFVFWLLIALAFVISDAMDLVSRHFGPVAGLMFFLTLLSTGLSAGFTYIWHKG